MARRETDIFISGGGIAGLVAALSFASSGFQVVLADPTPPALDMTDSTSDLRSTAFLQPARALLENAGLWDGLACHATPLETLRVIDLDGDPPVQKTERAFYASELNQPAFGWNLPNWLTRKHLIEAATKASGLELRLGTAFEKILTREGEALVKLDDGTRLSARLAIAADGRNSPLRQAVGIPVETARYGQKALAFAVSHPVAHGNVSTELYLEGGAFVLVPLPDHDGQPASAVVWMQNGPEAARLSKLDNIAFGAAASVRSACVLGELTPISPRRVWPVVTQCADSLIGERVALIAEAAHVMPPIGAQGLNTSLADVQSLVELAQISPGMLGNAEFLTAYEKSRHTDIRARAKVIDAYNRICKSNAPPVQALRRTGLQLVHDILPLRQAIMRAGMGQ
jgi:2-octaprenyl-6-methoxyphenol hydroxylase